MSKYHLECVKCSIKSKDFTNVQCPHNSYYDYLDVVYDYKNINQFPLKNKVGLERFLPLLPIKDIKVSLGEGNTPLFKLTNYLKKIGLEKHNIYVKNEAQNPTGCFKDLESLVMINKALEDDVKKMLVISSGNAAFSAAAYSNKAGLKCICVILKKTHQIKREGLEAFGVEIKEFPGSYEDAYRYFADNPIPGHLNITAGKNPFRIEGNKIIAFEIWEQMGVPDKIVVPVGNGGLLAGVHKGFYELKQIGKIKKLPQLIGVQVKGAAPVKKALEQNQDYVILKDIEDSIAEGIVATESYCSPKAVKAIKESKGEIVVVNDDEIKEALSDIMKLESLEPEPTSACVYAALKKMNIKPNEKVVCIQTGSSQRDIGYLISILEKK